jgi:hypothetical protein
MIAVLISTALLSDRRESKDLRLPFVSLTLRHFAGLS